MNSPQKALILSYGAFSCRLKGFDEPFALMQHIMDYIRDTIAEEPSFGDAAMREDLGMLVQIAQIEAGCPVHVRRIGTDVVLCPADYHDSANDMATGDAEAARGASAGMGMVRAGERASLDRLIAQTNRRLGDGDDSRRRSILRHLRRASAEGPSLPSAASGKSRAGRSDPRPPGRKRAGLRRLAWG